MMDGICVDEDDEIQQLQKELIELQKEREKYAKELRKRHLRNEIEKLKNENLQLKTKLIEHASQAYADKDNDVKPLVEVEKSIHKSTGNIDSGQDASSTQSSGSLECGQDKSIKKLTGSPGSGQDNNNQDKDEMGNKRRVGRPRKRPPSPDVTNESLPETEIESKRAKLLPCPEDIKDCEDNEDNNSILRENYIWNKNGSPQYLCNLCDFTCEYYIAIYSHMRKEHNKASQTLNTIDMPADRSKGFEIGPPTKTSSLRRASDYSDGAGKQTLDQCHEEICRSLESDVRQTSEEKQPSSSTFRRTSYHSNEERRKSSRSGVRQASEENIEGPKTNTTIANLFKQVSKGYECTVCDDVFHSYTVAYHHVIKHHAQPRYRCKYCKFKVYERHLLAKHFKNVHKGRKLAFIELDTDCQINTKEVEDLAAAKDTDTGNKDPSDCESDGHITEAAYESEEESDEDTTKTLKMGSLKYKIMKTRKGFKCGVCGHQTISYQGLYKHYQTNHKEMEAKFKCSFCSYTTNQRRYCKIHMKKAHKGKPIIYRTLGGTQTANKTVVPANASQDLTVTDYISKTTNGFKCTICGIMSEEYQKSRYHVYYQHFAVFVCPYCDFNSSNRPQVVAHGKKLHPGKSLKITWRVKGNTRKSNLGIRFEDENKKKNNSSDETGNKRPVGRPRKIVSSPVVAGESLPEIKREPGYMSISMNSKRVKLLPFQTDSNEIKQHVNKEVSINLNDGVSIKMEPNDLEQGDIRLMPNVYIDKDELCDFVTQVNEPGTDDPLGEMPILSSTTLVEEDPVPVSSTTVDVTTDEVDGGRDDFTLNEIDEARKDVKPEKVEITRENVTLAEVDEAREVATSDKGDIPREVVTPDKGDIAREVAPENVDMARVNGAKDHYAEKNDIERRNTAELNLDMEVETFDMEHRKKPSDSSHGKSEKKKDDGEDSDDVLSPRMCMHIDKNEIWEIRVDELQVQTDVLSQAKIKIEKEEEEASSL